MHKIGEIIKLLRPAQWIKNIIVLMPLIFGGVLFDMQSLISTLICTVGFCFISSSVYCINDVFDYQSDREDPVKSKRPVASGKVSKSEALSAATVTLACGVLIAVLFLPVSILIVMGLYFLLNLLYCNWLKHKVLIDVMIVAIGFVLRLVAGGMAASVLLSQWIVIMTFLLALFLAIAKRRHELVLVEREEKKRVRRSVEGYNLSFLDVALSILGAVIIVGYILYTLQPHPSHSSLSEYLYVTALPVLYGVLRYLRLTIVDNKSGSPTKVVYSDSGIAIAALIWISMFIFIIYL